MVWEGEGGGGGGGGGGWFLRMQYGYGELVRYYGYVHWRCGRLGLEWTSSVIIPLRLENGVFVEWDACVECLFGLGLRADNVEVLKVCVVPVKRTVGRLNGGEG